MTHGQNLSAESSMITTASLRKNMTHKLCSTGVYTVNDGKNHSSTTKKLGKICVTTPLPIDYVVIDSLEIILYLLQVRTVNLQADVSVQLTREGASSFGNGSASRIAE